MCNVGDVASLARVAVRQLIATFNWHLLPENEWVTRCIQVLACKPDLKPIQAGQNAYSKVLYEACRDAGQQEPAYLELHDYLYRIASCRRPELAEDATQEALQLVFEQIHACRDPGTFLCFARFKLLQAIAKIDRRHSQKRELTQNDSFLQSLEEPAPLDTIDDEVDALVDCIRQAWEKQPRAHDQLRAVLWKYLDELSDQEIAERLDKTPAQVHVLRNRGLKKLRQYMVSQS